MRVAELGANMAWQLEQGIGSDVSVALHGCTARLGGRVPSEVARQAVLDITTELAPWLNVIDELELWPPAATGHLCAESEDGDPVVPALDPVIACVRGSEHPEPAETVAAHFPGVQDAVDPLDVSDFNTRVSRLLL